MAQMKISALPNITTPNTPVIFNPDLCQGCNTCVNVCQVDVFIPSPDEGSPPMSAGIVAAASLTACIPEPFLSIGRCNKEAHGKIK